MAVLLILGCVAAAVFASVLPGLVLEVRNLPRLRRRGPDLREGAVGVCESLGHAAPMLRLARVAALRRVVEGLRGTLARRGLALTVEGTFAASVLCLASSVLLCVLVSGSVLGAAVALAVVASAWGFVRGADERALRDARAAQMPEVLRSLSGALSAGKSLSQAIEHVGSTLGEPMGTEFLRASFEIRGGRSVEEAVGALCARVDAPGVALLGTALQISQRTGSPLTDLFERTSRMVSDTVALRRELRVKTSQVRLSSRVVAAMPWVLCALLVLISQDYRAGLALPAGRACLLVAALLDALALWLIGRAMSGSLE